MSKIQTDKTQPSDSPRTLNSMMDKLENAAETLIVMLERIKKLESLEKSSRGDTTPDEKGPNTEETKQLTNDTTTSAETPHQKPSETHNETETTTNTGTNLQQSEDEIQASAPPMVREKDIPKGSVFTGAFDKIIKKVSSKSNYYILAVAIAILGIIIVKLYFMLFP